jgi:hypothetical protein
LRANVFEKAFCGARRGPLSDHALPGRFVRCLPRFGGGNFTPARRAFERPMAIACSGDRAPVFALSNVFHFFAHKLASLSAGRFAFALVFARAFDCFFFLAYKIGFAFRKTFGRK